MKYKKIAHDQPATTEDCSSAPCGHWNIAPFCVNQGKHQDMVTKATCICTSTESIYLNQRVP